MKKYRFLVTEYLRETLRDERRRKPFLVGLVVFVVVFIGLSAYQHSLEKKQGDVIISNSGSGAMPVNGGDAGGSTGAADVMNSGEDSGGAANFDGNANEDIGEQNPVGTETLAIFVDVGGAVQINGLFALPAGSRVDDAIEAAGGLTEGADMKYLNRAALLSDGDRLYVPTEAEVRDGTAPPSAGQVTASGGYIGSAASGGSVSDGTLNGQNDAGRIININTADTDELQKLNGVGPATAQKIIDYRTKSGGFKRVEEIMNVSGIGAKTFEKLKPYITV